MILGLPFAHIVSGFADDRRCGHDIDAVDAAKLARLLYRMLRYGMKYVDQGAAFYELKHRELQVQQLKCPAHAESAGGRRNQSRGSGRFGG